VYISYDLRMFENENGIEMKHTYRGCSCEGATNEGGNTRANALRPLAGGHEAAPR
jgi:hypothetical protein